MTVNWRYFGNVTPESFDQLVEDLRAGRLDGEVPPHGTLSRVQRNVGLRAGGGGQSGPATAHGPEVDLATRRTTAAVTSTLAPRGEGRGGNGVAGGPGGAEPGSDDREAR